MFLRLRKAARKHGVPVLRGRAVRHPRADEDVGHADPDRTRRRSRGAGRAGHRRVETLLDQPGAVIMVGERLATVARRTVGRGAARRRHRRPAGVGAAARRRARRAGGRRAAHAAARRPPRRRRAGARAGRAAWHVAELPAAPGRDAAASSPPPRTATLGALLVGGVEPADLPDPDAALAALERRRSSSAWSCGTARSPSAPTWCSRSRRSSRRPAPSSTGRAGIRPFEPVAAQHHAARRICRVLDTLADEMGVDLGLPTADGRRARNSRRWAPGTATRPTAPDVSAAAARPSLKGRGGADRLADAAGQRPAAGRRTAPGRNRAHAGGAAVGRLPRPRSAPPTATRSPSAPTRGAISAAAGRHRHARPGGVAAAELAGFGGAPTAAESPSGAVVSIGAG